MSTTSALGRFVSRRIVPPFLFLPRRIDADEGRPSRYGLAGAREVWIDADDARLHGWWIPPASGPGPEDAATEAGSGAETAVLYFHGNAGCLVERAFIAERFALAGHGTLLVDYRGYGRSTGRPEEEGLYADGRAARRWIVDELDLPPRRLALVGHSLGAPVAARTAADREVGALALSAAPASLPELARDLYPWLPEGLFRGWTENCFETVRYVAEVACPVLVARGSDDRMVSRSHADRIHAAARNPGPRYEAPGGGHNDVWDHPGYWTVHLAFLENTLHEI